VPLEFDDDTNIVHLDALKQPGEKLEERDRAYLIVIQGSNVGEMYKITKDEVVIGRGTEADLQFLDSGISRQHAGIRLEGKEMVVVDMGSRNGTFLNGERVDRKVLHDGDKIQVAFADPAVRRCDLGASL